MMLFIVLIFCGVAAGIIAGLFGVGGGILFTPILYFLFSTYGLEDPSTWAIATSLFCTFTASVSSSIQQRNERNFYWKEGITVGIFGSLGVYFGKMLVLSDYYTEEIFVSVFSMLLLMVAVLFFRKSASQKITHTTRQNLAIRKAGTTGGMGGFIAALAGVGGGIVMVPLMNLMYRLELSKAVSISSLAIVIISLSGWVQFAFFAGMPESLTQYAIGFVDFGTGFPLILGAFTGGFIGVRAGRRISRKLVQFSFAVLIIIIAIMMIRSVLS